MKHVQQLSLRPSLARELRNSLCLSSEGILFYGTFPSKNFVGSLNTHQGARHASAVNGCMNAILPETNIANETGRLEN